MNQHTCDSPASNRDEYLQLLASTFDYERGWTFGAPSPNYYWYHKRNCVVRLLKDNLHLLPKKRADGSPNKVIDIGCGGGADLYVIRDVLSEHHLECEYVGLEGHNSSFETCLLRKKYFGLDNVNFENVDLTKGLPCADASVDLVYCSEVTEHIPNPEPLLKEIRRVTRSGGLFILTTPNEPNLFQKAYWLPGARARVEAARQELLNNPQKLAEVSGKEVPLYGHVSCHTHRQWNRMASAAGFQIKDFQRGAIVYGGTKFHNRKFVLGMRFLLEAFLDLLPKQLAPGFSDQVINLYQAVD